MAQHSPRQIQEEEHEVEIKEEMAEEIKGCHDEAEAKQIQILVGVEEETMKWMQDLTMVTMGEDTAVVEDMAEEAIVEAEAATVAIQEVITAHGSVGLVEGVITTVVEINVKVSTEK